MFSAIPATTHQLPLPMFAGLHAALGGAAPVLGIVAGVVAAACLLTGLQRFSKTHDLGPAIWFPLLLAVGEYVLGQPLAFDVFFFASGVGALMHGAWTLVEVPTDRKLQALAAAAAAGFGAWSLHRFVGNVPAWWLGCALLGFSLVAAAFGARLRKRGAPLHVATGSFAVTVVAGVGALVYAALATA